MFTRDAPRIILHVYAKLALGFVKAPEPRAPKLIRFEWKIQRIVDSYDKIHQYLGLLESGWMFNYEIDFIFLTLYGLIY